MSKDFKADEKAWAHYWNYHGLIALEKLMKDTAGKYSVGGTFCLADAYLVPQAWAAFNRFNINPDEFPIIKRVYHNLLRIPEIQKAAPDNQPDYQR